MARLVCPGDHEWMYLTLEGGRASEAGMTRPEWVQWQQTDLEKLSRNETHVRLALTDPKELAS